MQRNGSCDQQVSMQKLGNGNRGEGGGGGGGGAKETLPRVCVVSLTKIRYPAEEALKRIAVSIRAIDSVHVQETTTQHTSHTLGGITVQTKHVNT